MVTETLVSIDIDRGAEILKILDAAKLKVCVAAWMFLSEYEDWRLVVSARLFDSPGPRSGYGLLRHSLTAAGLEPHKIPTMLILPMTDPSIRDLRRIFRKAKSVEGMRLGGQMIGDRFLQDAYVYRIS